MIEVIRIKQGQPLPARLLDGARDNSAQVREAVAGIIADVRARGDAAVLEYTRRFDGAALDAASMRVKQAEIDAAYERADARVVAALERAAANIRAFHMLQKEKSWLDVTPERTLGQLVLPLGSVGVYVPGGRAAYPSSVLMTVIPAQVAGVVRIVMCTPPGEDGAVNQNTLLAAKLLGVGEIYKIGGAQAVAAMAFGTDTVARVDKIVGPGNAYVAEAKRAVYGHVGIDMIAGPSEVLVVADGSANAAHVAADMLSQAEHDPDAAAMLFTDDEQLAGDVARAIDEQLRLLKTACIAETSIGNNGIICIVDTLMEAVRCANDVAPEHLELAVSDPYALLGCIKNAGAVFMGAHTPEPIGDYYAGPNHVLPTSGTARYASPLGVYDFIKRSSVLNFSQNAFEAAADDVALLAEAEGLYAHARSVTIRQDGQ